MSTKKETARLVAWLTGAIIGIATLILPLGYYFLARQYMLGSLETDARLNARAITQIMVNPAVWQFRQTLLQEYLARHPQTDVPETRRILNGRGELVAESTAPLEPPVVVRSFDLVDSGVVVGRIEIYRSLRPLLMRAGLILILVLPLGTGAFAVLQFVPIRGMRRAEEALREAEETYRALIEPATVGILIADADAYTIRQVNRKIEELLGAARSETLGKPLRNLFSEDQQEEWDGLRKDIEQGGKASPRDLVLCRADGATIPIEISASVARFRGERFVQCILRDITERVHADEIRQALYHASLEIQTPRPIRERLNRLLLTMRELLLLDGVAVLLADPEGTWLQVASTLGTDDVSEGLRVPIGPEGGAIAKAYQSREMVVCNGEAPVPEEFRLKSPYDQLAGLRARVFAIVPLVVEGRAIGVVGAHRKHSRRAFEPGTLEIFQLFAGHAAPAIEQARLYEELRRSAAHLEAVVEDRTRELQRANAKLRDATRRAEEASRRKSAFLADMSHEIRTPLNAVIGFSELLQGQGVGPLNEKQARYVSHVLKSGKHLHQLIGDILDLSKVEAGKVVLQPQPLSVAATLEDVLMIVRGLANKKGQAVEADVEAGLPILTADPVRFKQICFNLLSNAVKYTPEQGRVRLVARRVNGADAPPGDSPRTREDSKVPAPEPAGDFLEIRVADTGIGIKAEDLSRLFQEFVRLEGKTGNGEEGTGLGLSLAKKLVDLHGGRIWAESEGEGRGSTFAVRLPFGGPRTSGPASP
jgi:PAS domain S-box-containing protein